MIFGIWSADLENTANILLALFWLLLLLIYNFYHMSVSHEPEATQRELNLAERLSEERYLDRMATQLPIHQEYGKYLSKVGVPQDLIDQALLAWQRDLKKKQEQLDGEDPISQLQNLLGRATEGESDEGRRILEASILELEKTRTHIVDVRESRINPAGNIETREEGLFKTYSVPTFVILGGAYSPRNPDHVKLSNKVLTLLEVLKPGETGASLGQEARDFVDSHKDSPSAQNLLPGQLIRGPIFPRTGNSINISGSAVGPFATNIADLEIRLPESPMLRVIIRQRDMKNIQPPIRR